MKHKLILKDNSLPCVEMKTRTITFDDRLQQVRILHKDTRTGKYFKGFNSIEFLKYKDDVGFRYVKRYRENWADIVRV